MKLEVGLGARSDVAEIAEYIDLRTPGRGELFIDAVEAGFKKIEDAPRIQPPTDDGPPEVETRYHLLKGFRYRIVFAIHLETAFVMAVGHVHRRADFWLDRLPDAI